MKTILFAVLVLGCSSASFVPEDISIADPAPEQDAGVSEPEAPDAKVYPDVRFEYDSGPEPAKPDTEWETVGRGCNPVMDAEVCNGLGDGGKLYPMVCFDADPPGGIPIPGDDAAGQLFCSPEPCMSIPDPWRGRGCGVGESMIYCYDNRPQPNCRDIGNGTHCC